VGEFAIVWANANWHVHRPSSHQKRNSCFHSDFSLNPAPVDYGFAISSSNLEVGELRRRSMVRYDKVYTLSQVLAVKRFGRVDTDTLERIRVTLLDLLATKGSWQ
jgi:hypothetical protein